MNQEMIELKEKFDGINKQGWIKAPRNEKNSSGILFEQLLGKPIENFEIPDFKGIEIKTHDQMSQSQITLFSANPEGPAFFEIERLCKNYGYSSKSDPTSQVLFGDVKATYRQQIGLNYFYQLKIDYNQQCIYLIIFDRQGIVIDHSTYWSFTLLKEKLIRKLQYLALVSVQKKWIGPNLFFHYQDITFYQLKNFETFLQLLETGKVIITFAVGVFKTGKRKGQIHNHGVLFRIQNRNLLNLFNLIQDDNNNINNE